MSESQDATRRDDTQQGFSASEIEAMRASQNVAISSNEKIFPVFAKKLASGDPKEYINTTNKLAAWLTSEKAYYPAARTQIVKLLEIALSTFVQTFVRRQVAEELAEQLKKLVASVIPFLHLFPEIELQARLQRVVQQTVLYITTPSTSAVVGPAPFQSLGVPSASSPIATSPVSPQSSMPLIPNTSTVPSMLRSPPVPRPPVPPFAADSIPSAVPNVSSSPHVSLPPTRFPVVEPSPTPISPTMAYPQETSETMSPVSSSKPQPRRLRRAELPEELKARDLDWFKSSHSVVLGGAEAGTGASASSSTGGESSAMLAADTSPLVSTSTLTSTSPKKKTARIVPSRVPRRLPLALALETTQGEGQILPASGLATDKSVSFETVATTEDVPMDVDDPGPHLQTTLSGTPVTHEIDEVKRRSSSSDQKIVPVPPTSVSMELPQKLEAASPSTSAEFLVSTGPLAPPAEITEKPRLSLADLYALPPHSPPLRQLGTPILPTRVAAVDPPLNLHFKIPMRLNAGTRQGQTGTDQPRFDGKMTVVHIIHARPFTHTHIVEMILNDSLFSDVAKWVNRKAEPNHAPRGVCISLGCYRLPEFFKTMRSKGGERGTQSIEDLMFKSSCSWPGSNRMSLHVKRDTKDVIVTLSPPLFFTPDQCVDISSLLTLGSNTFSIKQTGDLSEYGLVVHAHPPTRDQLAELEMVTEADERWKRFLETICVKVGRGEKVRGGPGEARGLSTAGGGTEGVVGVL